MKKTYILFTILILSIMPLFSQSEHWSKIFKVGLPALDDHKYFPKDTLIANAPRPLALSKKYNKKEIPKALLARMMFMRTTGFLVLKDNEILHEEYWLNYDKDSVTNSFSMAKSIVSLLVGVAIGEGKIQSVNQKVMDFLPQFSKGLDTSLRIIDLLTMSSGSSWSEDFTNPNSDIVKAYYGSDLSSLIKKTYTEKEPGKEWCYQCGNTVILSLLLEAATGQKIYEYAQEKLWTPLGATHNAYWGKDKETGITKAFCCFYATPRDFAKIGLLILNKGKVNGKQIIPKEYIEQATQPASWATFRKKPVEFFGFHLWLVTYKKQKIPYLSGVLGQYVFIFPDQNAVVVRVGEMINALSVQPTTPDVPLYLNVASKLLR